MKSLTDTFTLANDVNIPCVGFGTWQTPDGKVAVDAVKSAIESGYRHIDAAAVYGNEQSVGEGIGASGIAREKLFITSKLWNDEHGYESTLAACEKSIKDLNAEYLDLYLIHWPVPCKFHDDWEAKNAQTWQAFEKLYADGRVRAIGVSNFLPHHIEAIKKTAKVLPMVNQIEYHPGLMQQELVEYCRNEGMLIEAYSPLGTGKLLSDATLMKIAEKYGKSVAHICIRWVLQKGILPLPKSVTPSRIADNTRVFDFEITAEDMLKIDNMPIMATINDPNNIDF
ncbi:MAG: aldo/keto reductase [Christensenella sp.]